MAENDKTDSKITESMIIGHNTTFEKFPVYETF